MRRHVYVPDFDKAPDDIRTRGDKSVVPCKLCGLPPGGEHRGEDGRYLEYGGSALLPAVYPGCCGECGTEFETDEPIGYVCGLSSPLCGDCWGWFQ